MKMQSKVQEHTNFDPKCRIRIASRPKHKHKYLTYRQIRKSHIDGQTIAIAPFSKIAPPNHPRNRPRKVKQKYHQPIDSQ